MATTVRGSSLLLLLLAASSCRRASDPAAPDAVVVRISGDEVLLDSAAAGKLAPGSWQIPELGERWREINRAREALGRAGAPAVRIELGRERLSGDVWAVINSLLLSSPVELRVSLLALPPAGGKPRALCLRRMGCLAAEDDRVRRSLTWRIHPDATELGHSWVHRSCPGLHGGRLDLDPRTPARSCGRPATFRRVPIERFVREELSAHLFSGLGEVPPPTLIDARLDASVPVEDFLVVIDALDGSGLAWNVGPYREADPGPPPGPR